jgi:hypothetical protein
LPLYFKDEALGTAAFTLKKSAIMIRWNDAIWVMAWDKTQVVFSKNLVC